SPNPVIMISPARWFSAPRRGRYSTEGSFVLFVEGGRDAGRETGDAPDPGSFTTVLWQQAAAAGDCQEPWAEPGRGVGLFEPGAGGGHRVAACRGYRRRAARSAAISAAIRNAGGSAADARLGLGAPRTA